MSIRTRLASGYRAIPTANRGVPVPAGTKTTTSGRNLPGRNAGLGMTIKTPSGGGSLAATTPITYSTPGQPQQPQWDASLATRQYLSNVYVMRSFRTIADTVAGLAWQTGMDPESPAEHGSSPLSQLLGPASPLSPGGPNVTTSSRAFWAWSIVQFLITGRWAWEFQRDPLTPAFDGNKLGQIFGMWPLVCACLNPIAAPAGATRWYDGFEYNTPVGRRQMDANRVFYAWRPSATDWREPESDLQSLQLPISIVNGINKYMWSLLKNDMVASKIIVTPPFEEDDQRRSWQDQFVSEFTGFDNAGKSIFAEAENDIDETTGKSLDNAKVQVIDIAQKGVDAQLLEMLQQAKIDTTIGTGVPISLLGNASQRTYANADSEYRNYWTIRVLPLLSELQDPVNVGLAPQLGRETGWFDLSRVVALQPPTVFAPPAVTDMLEAGVITTADVANILNLPSLENSSEDTTTAPVGEEAIQSGAMGGRSWVPTQQREGYRAVHHGMRLAQGVFAERKPLNTHTLRSGVWKVVERREKAVASSSGVRSAVPSLATETATLVERIRRRREMGLRAVSNLKASGIAVKAADTGRVLMLQRALDDTDPASGRFEFPGGHIEPGEDSYDAASREWGEEVGLALPKCSVAGSWTSPNGVYRGHVVMVPHESDLAINPDKPTVKNPDNTGGKYKETAVWLDPDHIADNPAVRDEVSDSAGTWLPVVKAAQPIDTAGTRALDEFDDWFAANSARLLEAVS